MMDVSLTSYLMFFIDNYMTKLHKINGISHFHKMR